MRSHAARGGGICFSPPCSVISASWIRLADSRSDQARQCRGTQFQEQCESRHLSFATRLCVPSVSTSSHFGTVRFGDSALPFPVTSPLPALAPVFPAPIRAAKRFPLPFNGNVSVTPLFVAFTPKHPLSHLSTAFTQVTGGSGSAEPSVSTFAGPHVFQHRTSNHRMSKRLLPLTPLLPLSLQHLEHALSLFSIAYSLFLQNPGGWGAFSTRSSQIGIGEVRFCEDGECLRSSSSERPVTQ